MARSLFEHPKTSGCAHSGESDHRIRRKVISDSGAARRAVIRAARPPVDPGPAPVLGRCAGAARCVPRAGRASTAPAHAHDTFRPCKARASGAPAPRRAGTFHPGGPAPEARWRRHARPGAASPVNGRAVAAGGARPPPPPPRSGAHAQGRAARSRGRHPTGRRREGWIRPSPPRTRSGRCPRAWTSAAPALPGDAEEGASQANHGRPPPIGCPRRRGKRGREVAWKRGVPPRARRRGRTSPEAALAGLGHGGRPRAEGVAGNAGADREGGGGGKPCTKGPHGGSRWGRSKAGGASLSLDRIQ